MCRYTSTIFLLFRGAARHTHEAARNCMHHFTWTRRWYVYAHTGETRANGRRGREIDSPPPRDAYFFLPVSLPVRSARATVRYIPARARVRVCVHLPARDSRERAEDCLPGDSPAAAHPSAQIALQARSFGAGTVYAPAGPCVCVCIGRERARDKRGNFHHALQPAQRGTRRLMDCGARPPPPPPIVVLRRARTRERVFPWLSRVQYLRPVKNGASEVRGE